MLQRISIGGDSSDEDVPKPMNFSALTKALLEDKQATRPKSPPNQPDRSIAYRAHESHSKTSHETSLSRTGTPSRGTLRVIRKTPPPNLTGENEIHRVVHISGSRRSGELRRSKSTLEGSNRTRAGTPQELVTPAPAPRYRYEGQINPHALGSEERIHGRSGSASHVSNGSSQQQPHASSSSYASSFEHAQMVDNDDGAQSRSRNGSDQLHGSMRVRRPPMGTGTLLRGAPMRRGVRRQLSEDANSPQDEDFRGRDDQHAQADYEPRNENNQCEENRNDEAPLVHERVRSRAPSMSQSAGQRHTSPSREQNRDAPSSRSSHRRLPSRQEQQPGFEVKGSAPIQPVYRVPDFPPKLSLSEQENEPPPTFKRNKGQTSGLLGNQDKLEKPAMRDTEKESKVARDVSASQASSNRPALQPLSQNTPLRPAPPPPKMSVVDAATGAAGASTVKSKKKRSHVIVNSKLFEIRGRIGRGGSSNVYRVMAENDKMFALKKVNLEDCNEDSIRGYKGEIELLKALENEERVVRLFDYEVNEQKQSLSVLMEMGESDLNKVLATRLQPEDAVLDLSFTRHYWREMLCCVSAVHAHDIVHSDLKPANFLLVCGRLKLIDFGIANAIDVENTVNVHRETNVGTPNYMSPESLQDTNAGADPRQPGGGGHAGKGSTKLMKLGKPSDVWSLGCILYQMTYGKPPFAHISNTWHRVCAIINPNVHISYPTSGIGGTYIPTSLRRLLQRCLDRDQNKRPTVAQLLDSKETFLNPDTESEDAVPMTEALLGQILMKVVQRCKDEKRGFPTEGELLRTYPRGYMENIRSSIEKGWG